MSHHPFGGSCLYRRHKCPGSYREEQGVSDIATPAATEGTTCHALLADMIESWRAGDDEPALSDTYDDVTDEMGALVRSAFGFFLNLWGKLECKRRESVHVEQHVGIQEGPSGQAPFGTADVVITAPTSLVVIDWKFGRLPIDAEECEWQAMMYGAAAMGVFIYTDCECYIYNPRTRQTLSSAFGEADGALQKIEETIAACLALDAETQVGSWCRHCRKRGICAASVADAKELASLVSEPVKTAAEAKRAAAAEVAEMPPEKLLPILEMAMRVKPAFEAVMARAKELLGTSPDALPGWELRSRAGARSAPLAEAYEAVSSDVGRDEFFAACKLSVSKLEKAYIDAHPDRKKNAAVDEFREKLDGIVSRPTIVEMRRKK